MVSPFFAAEGYELDYLWSPWRYRYVSAGGPRPECIFCAHAASQDDRANLVVLRAKHNFVLLNLYPYTSGHLMIAPYAHIATLADADSSALEEMMRLTAHVETALRTLYKPDGLNLGMNLGQAAGAGVAGHIHLHVLPRWSGDASFITTVGETRVLPEELGTTYDRLKEQLGSLRP